MATRQLSARPAFAVVQISALSVGLLALVLLVLLRTDLIASWRNATPPDAPDRFVINIQPEQDEAFQHALRKAGVSDFDWYPMIRGRLVSINGQTVDPASFATDRAQRLVEREFNLSHTASCRPTTRWWPGAGPRTKPMGQRGGRPGRGAGPQAG
jgi:putative ABC transport system permease protein